ncbi:MAG: hypothetical protein K2O44_02240 [Clostridia bacterium]|nr:hypothetical protein [Clostridia bacterium]
MKNKKLLTTLSAVAMATVLGVTALAGCNKDKHNYVWDTESEIKATCTTEGKRRGICTDCGYVKEESTPIDPDNHNYADWEVSKYPDGTNVGEAVKKCTYNSEHTITAELPRLTESGEGYISSTTVKPATAIAVGERELVLENAAGNITFTVEIPKREVKEVEDAVLLGSSLGSLIRSASGHYSDTAEKIEGSTVESSFSCYYGDGYTYIKDEGDNDHEYWISRDGEGKVFGILTDKFTDPHAGENITDDYLLGFGYSSGASELRTHGAESTLLQYYERAQIARSQGTAVNYDENITTRNGGGFRAWFSYGYYENPNFARYRVDFDIDQTGVIVSLKLSTSIIRAYLIADDSYGNKLFYDNGDVIYAEVYERENGDDVYEMDADGIIYDGYKTDSKGNELKDYKGDPIPRPKPGNRGNDTKRYYYSDDHTEVSKRELVYDAPVLKTSADVVPECPYSSDDLYISSFQVSYNNRVVNEDGVTMDANRNAVFEIAQIQPTTATIEYDPIRVYLRTASRDVELTMDANDNSYNTTGSFSIVEVETGTGANRKKVKVGRVTVNARYAGELTLVFKTKGGKFEKEVKLNIEKGVPEAMTAEAYVYNDSTGTERHLWTVFDDKSDPIEIYVGETLRVRAVPIDSEAQYVDASFTAEGISIANPLNVTEFTINENFNGITVAEGVFAAAGDYAVYLSFNRDRNVFQYFDVKVLPVPDMRPAIGIAGNGAEYTAHSNYIQLSGNAHPTSADLNVKFTPSASNWRRGTVTVEINGNTAVYDYEYSQDTGKLVTAYKSGISGDTLDFSLEINEMYKVVLKHSIGYGDNVESLVLKKVEAES